MMRNFTTAFLQFAGTLAVGISLCFVPRLFDAPLLVYLYIEKLGNLGFAMLVVSTLLHATAMVIVLPEFGLPTQFKWSHIALGLLFSLLAAVIAAVGLLWTFDTTAYEPVWSIGCFSCGMYGTLAGLLALGVFGGRLCQVGFGHLGDALCNLTEAGFARARCLFR